MLRSGALNQSMPLQFNLSLPLYGPGPGSLAPNDNDTCPIITCPICPMAGQHPGISACSCLAEDLTRPESFDITVSAVKSAHGDK